MIEYHSEYSRSVPSLCDVLFGRIKSPCGRSEMERFIEIKGISKEYFKNRRYQLGSETDDTLTFIRRSTAERISRMYEDRITLSRTENGFKMEGLRKDVLLAASGLEHTLTRD